MIDPVGLPIILKTLDFLFTESQKILQERRERRAEKASPTTHPNQDEQEILTSKQNYSESISSIKEALSLKISESLVANELSEIEHLLRLKDVYLKRHQLSKEKISIYGTLDTPYKVLHELEESEQGIEEVASKLASILSRIYNKEIIVNK